MLRQFFLITIRRLVRNPFFSFLNIFGLVLGMAAFILLLQYVVFEQGYNRFHTKLPELYRLVMQNEDQTLTDDSAPGLAPRLRDDAPEIIGFCRIADGSNLGHGTISLPDSAGATTSFRENEFAYVDGSFFSLFTFQIIKGNADVLMQPNTMAISASQAKKYFGNRECIGATVTLHNQFGETTYTIGAVYGDMPNQSDLRFPMLFSLSTLANPANLNGNEQWASLDAVGPQWMSTWLQLIPEANISETTKKINNTLHKADGQQKRTALLQPMTQVHLSSSLNDPMPVSGSLSLVYLLIFIASLIIFIAWFNYVNLTTARALRQAKEVGIRKVVGASRAQLIVYYLSEALLLNIVALGLALAVVNLFQPLFNELVGLPLSFQVSEESTFVFAAFVVLFAGAALSGFYTAFVLSSYQPAKALKGKVVEERKGLGLRKILVVAQFSISVFLIGMSLILFSQLQYLFNVDLGLTNKPVLIVQGPEIGKGEAFSESKDVFPDKVAQLSYVSRVSRTGAVPMEGFNFASDHVTRIAPEPGDENIRFNFLFVDENFLPTYEINLLSGRNFSKEECTRGQSRPSVVLLNETALHTLRLGSPEDAIGQRVSVTGEIFTVAGIIKDYHHTSLRSAIEPLLVLPSGGGGMYTVQLEQGEMKEKIEAIGKLFASQFPGNPFTYRFLDDTYERLYRSEVRYAQLFISAAGLAILIACLGLLGLAAYSVEQRAKEIGIRKVLGASVWSINRLLSWDFLKLIALASAVSIPLIWWSGREWLSQFAYHTNVSWVIYALAGGIAFALAMLTISSQALKAASASPVDNLRSE